MLRNYLKIAFRNLVSHKVFSLINIFGLSIGIACCVLIALFIHDEFSYEKQFTGADKIYRIITSLIKDDGTSESFPTASPPVAQAMMEEIPEVESATRFVGPFGSDQLLIRYQDKIFYENDGVLVDSTFFNVFSYEFLEGDRKTALSGRSMVVLSENLNKKLFGNQGGLDHLIVIQSAQATDTFRVTGVIKKPVKKSHVDRNFYMSMNSKGLGDYVRTVTTWAGQNFTSSYVKIKPKATASGIEDKMVKMLDLHGAKDLKELGIKKKMHLQPLLDVRLFSNFTNRVEFGPVESSITNIYILGSIGLFILLIACINFMNLTTAKASQRAGEVGVRKSLGANRQHLIRQFLGESMTLVAIATVLAIGIAQGVLPMFNNLTGKDLSVNVHNAGYIGLALLGIMLVTGFVAGSYPAFFLSSFQPAQVLKDRRLSGGGGTWIRKSLVVFQFVISITLISSIFIIQEQMKFVQNQPLGFNPDYKIMIPMRTEEAKKNYTRVRDKFKQIAGINAVSGTTVLPSTAMFSDFPLYPDGSNMEKAHVHFNINIDENYFSLLGIKLLSGRDLISGMDTVSFANLSKVTNHAIVNQASLKVSGIDPAKALGQRLNIDWQSQHFTFEIVGVVEDYHQTSLHRPISPLMFLIPANPGDFAYTVASVNAGNYKDAVGQMGKVWKELVPNTPFEYQFLTESIGKQYEIDQREGLIINIATTLAILISCMGLYGLSIYVAERRVKEIGIRKVMGASVTGIVRMLSMDFIKLVLIAFVLAAPLGYWAMNLWLERFAFKIELTAFVFVLAGFVSFAIAWITVGFESIRAAMGNPVDSLRNE